VAAPDLNSIHDRPFALGEVAARPMLGGLGLYWRGTICGILFSGRFYFKVDDGAKSGYVAGGMGPFRPTSGRP